MVARQACSVRVCFQGVGASMRHSPRPCLSKVAGYAILAQPPFKHARPNDGRRQHPFRERRESEDLYYRDIAGHRIFTLPSFFGLLLDRFVARTSTAATLNHETSIRWINNHAVFLATLNQSMRQVDFAESIQGTRQYFSNPSNGQTV